MKNPISILLALLLMVPISSCSKPDLAGIVREHVAAVNTDDIEKNLTFFTDDSVFEPDPATKLSGKAQVRNLMEWDVGNNARLSIKDLRVEGNTAIAELTEDNEGWRLLGIDIPFTATYEFRGRKIRSVKLEFSPESWKMFEGKFGPFAEWAKRTHPEEYQRMNQAGYSAEGSRFFLSLAKEWRDKIQTESVEKELIKLENEWADALVKQDWTFLDRILAEDYVATDDRGIVSTKAQEIAFLKSGEFAFMSCLHHELKVRVYGDAAVVTGHTTTKETYKGKDYINDLRWTDTWVTSAGRWLCVAGHSSVIARK
jgi:ketosteroid isomerase-like protein